MKAPRVYLDTSVIGGCFDAEFAPWSNGLVADFRAELASADSAAKHHAPAA